MSNISQTYSGDFTSFIAGKLLNAAGMAKGESDRRETENLEKGRPGSLFAKALQSEFGGDLYNRNLGNFDPRKGAGETDRSTSKEGRYKAQFADVPSKSKSDLEDAEQELLKDDDSIPVKNVDAREHISKIIGVGLDVKLIQADARIQKVSNQVSSVQDTVVQTQKLLVDQTELLGAKFDTILDIFSGQLAYQQKISDEAEVRRRETELEQEKDLSTTRKIEGGFNKKKKGPDILGNILGIAADMLRGRKSPLTKKLLEALLGSRGKPGSIFSGIRKALGGKKAIYETLRADTLEEALGITSRPLRKRFQKTKEKDARLIASFLEVPVEKLPQVLKSGKFEEELEELVGMGMDPKEAKRLKKSAKNIVRSSPRGKVGSLKRMGDQVFRNLASSVGAKKLAKSGTSGITKGLGKAGKFVPGLGTGIALAEAGYRFSQGDTVGALMSVGSAIPILGWGFTAFDIARDLGFDPLDTLPADQQFERGTNLTKPGLAEVHGTEAILGKTDRSDMLSSYEQAVNQIGSTLVSSSVSFADAVGMGGEVKSHLKSTGLSFDIVNIPVSTKIGRGSKTGPLSSLEDSFTRDIFARREEKEEELEKEVEDGDDNNDENQPDPQNNGGQRPRALNPLPTGSYASGTWIGSPGDKDGNQTGLNMNLPGGIGTPIYAPIDLIYKTVGTDGKPAVGLDGNADPLGPAGRGFGYYGAYFFEKDGKEYEVLLGHFRDLPYKGSSDGEKIPKGTLLGYQGASGRSKSRTGGVYPHITLHVNGIGHFASNSVLTWFANGLATSKKSTGPTSPGYGNGGDRSLIPMSPIVGGTGGPKPTTRREQALLDTISFAEGTTSSYGTIFGGKVIPELANGDLTVREVYDMMMTGMVRGRNAGYASGSYATGRYQFMPDTIDDIVNKYKTLKWTDKFTPTAQDRAILSRIANFRGVTDDMLKREGLSNRVLDMLSGEFASFPQYDGSSMYNQPVKSQDKLRQIYQKNLETIPTTPEGIQKQIERNQWLKDNDPANYFGSNLDPRDKRMNSLYANSSTAEDMEESSIIQQVYVVNNNVASTSLPPIITSSGRSNDNYVDQYRMAILGA